MGSVNMRRIAQRARVSASTVSVVLNRTPHVPVADATRRKVLAAARTMGYQEASLSRAIKTPLRHVGIAVGDLVLAQESFTALIFRGAQEHLLGRGYYALLQPVAHYVSETKSDTASVPTKILELHRSRLMDGVILDKQYFLDDEVLRLRHADLPLVAVNAGLHVDPAGLPIPSVTINDHAAGRLAAAHLLGLGHRRIAYIGRPWQHGPRAFRSTPVFEFRRGFEEALADAFVPLDPALTHEGDLLDKSINYAAVAGVMKLASPPTAIVAGDDQIAVMAINALRQRGLRVPEDVSVVGCGDLSTAQRLVEPGLTTVHAPLYENGVQAATLLLALIEGKPVAQPQIVLEPRLVVRGTTSARQ